MLQADKDQNDILFEVFLKAATLSLERMAKEVINNSCRECIINAIQVAALAPLALLLLLEARCDHLVVAHLN